MSKQISPFSGSIGTCVTKNFTDVTTVFFQDLPSGYRQFARFLFELPPVDETYTTVETLWTQRLHGLYPDKKPEHETYESYFIKYYQGVRTSIINRIGGVITSSSQVDYLMYILTTWFFAYHQRLADDAYFATYPKVPVIADGVWGEQVLEGIHDVMRWAGLPVMPLMVPVELETPDDVYAAVHGLRHGICKSNTLNFYDVRNVNETKFKNIWGRLTKDTTLVTELVHNAVHPFILVGQPFHVSIVNKNKQKGMIGFDFN